MSDIGIQLHPLATLLVVDSTQPHEHIPHGVPASYSWFAGPITQDPANRNAYPNGNPWGQLYAAADGNPHPGAEVEIRDMQAYVLTDGEWTPLYPAPPALGGAEYPESFQGGSVGGNIDTGTPGSEIVSPVPGRLFHVYPDAPRASIPAGIQGLIVVARARLAADWTDAEQQPRLVFNVGADWWAGPTSGTVSGVGQGRMKTVKREWRVFTYTTLTVARVASMRDAGTLPPVNVDPGELY